MNPLPTPCRISATLRSLPGRALAMLPAVILALLPVMALLLALAPGNARVAEVCAVRVEQQARNADDQRIMSTVRALAQALGEVAQATPPAEREGKLIRAISPVRYGDGPWDYVFLSRGTVHLHTPGMEGAAGVDFADTTDANGVAFVREMQSRAILGGGFTDWAARRADGTTEIRRVYSLVVPGTEYWLGAWTTPDEATDAKNEARRETLAAADHATHRAALWGIMAGLPAALVLHRLLTSSQRMRQGKG